MSTQIYQCADGTDCEFIFNNSTPTQHHEINGVTYEFRMIDGLVGVEGYVNGRFGTKWPEKWIFLSHNHVCDWYFGNSVRRRNKLGN